LSLKLVRCSMLLMVTTAAVSDLGFLQKKGWEKPGDHARG